jgi:glycosyltransferase involved in cell wall biosynthesis
VILPTVSIVTPHYNHGSVIGRCVASVAAQTGPVLEQVVVDDCSTDGSLADVEKASETHRFVRVLENPRNFGPVVTLGNAIHACRGEFVIPLAADDCLDRKAVEIMAAVAQSHREVAVVCGDIEFLDVRTGKVTRRRFLHTDTPTFISPRELVGLYRKCVFLPGCGVMVRRSALLSAAIDNPDLRWHHDNVAFSAVALRYGVWYVPEVVHRFQKYGGSNYGRGARNWPSQRSVIRAFLALLRDKPFSDLQPLYKDGAFLALFPHSLRYILTQPDARPYLSGRLITNALLLHLLYAIRPHLPATAVNWYVWLRGSKLT